MGQQPDVWARDFHLQHTLSVGPLIPPVAGLVLLSLIQLNI
jgi:hypothetical protein